MVFGVNCSSSLCLLSQIAVIISRCTVVFLLSLCTCLLNRPSLLIYTFGAFCIRHDLFSRLLSFLVFVHLNLLLSFDRFVFLGGVFVLGMWASFADEC